VAPRRRLTREESKARTRKELLRAANRLFVRNGFVATSLADIAEEAGLTKGAVYSNFESKEDLFLALLHETDEGKRTPVREDLAPSDLSHVSGATPRDRARAWGEELATARPTRRNVALLLEMNAFALRNERTRASVAEHNRGFFLALGTNLAELLDAPDADPEMLGLVAQSLYVGLQMHGAFVADGLDDEVFARAYELLAALAHATDRV
jgi:AcrR family transcriptional regulator